MLEKLTFEEEEKEEEEEGSLNVGEAHIGLKLNWKQHKF